MKLILFFSILLFQVKTYSQICLSLFRIQNDIKETLAVDSVQFSSEISEYFRDKTVVSVLGSSRLRSENPNYQLAYDISFELGARGYSIMTGGGPGIMHAANKGAFEAQAPSIGIDVVSAWARHPTDFMNRVFIFEDLQVRKKIILDFSRAWLVFPGGLGSLDEVFTIIGSIYSGKTPKYPVVLVDRSFWMPLLEHINKVLINEYKTVKVAELDFLYVLDTKDEVVEMIVNANQK